MESLSRDALAGDFDFPPFWGVWRLLCMRLETDMEFSLDPILPSIRRAASHQAKEPFWGASIKSNCG